MTPDEKIFLIIFALSALTVFGLMIISNIVEKCKIKQIQRLLKKRAAEHRHAIRHATPNQFAELGNKYMLDCEVDAIINELKGERN